MFFISLINHDQQVDTKYRKKNNTDKDQHGMHSCKCMPTWGFTNTHTHTQIWFHPRIQRTRTDLNTHALINTASHRSSALHVGHGIKGGGSAGV